MKEHFHGSKQVKMKFSQLNFIISIYNNPVAADKDCSATMSVTEGIFFALAMSVDGFFGGLGAAFLDISIAGTVCLNLVFSALAVLGGSAVGKYAADRCKRDYSWIGGVLFVVLAFSKIL